MIGTVSGAGQSIATGNWFVSLSLTETLLNYYNITIVGTIRKDKKEILAALITQGKLINSRPFALKGNLTMVAYT